MPTVARPSLLASSEGLADAADADISPPAGESWEVHSIVVGGAADLKRIFDPDESGTLTNPITIYNFTAADELHGLKLELHAGSTNPTSGIRITNTSGAAIDVYVFGVVIS